MCPDQKRDERSDGSAVGDSFDPLLRDAVEDVLSSACQAAPRSLLPGDVLVGRFVIDRVAGAGGMGTIYRGMDRWMEQQVAIKVLTSPSPRLADRFDQEAMVLAELSHRAIVRHIAHGSDPLARQFLVMEWLDGEDVAQRLARAPLTLAESLSILRCACEAMAVAHARGVVHRDLKPSNLFLVHRDTQLLKVLDFGIARRFIATRTLTGAGGMLGTVAYMAPEQAMEPHHVDARADVFALGCVFYECLTGRPPFAASSDVALLAKVLCEEPHPLDELRPDLDRSIGRLVSRMLAKDRELRPHDAAALLAELDEFAAPTEAQATSGARREPGLTTAEQKIVSVILGSPHANDGESGAISESDLNGLRGLTRCFAADPILMQGGRLLFRFADRGAATDQAGQAASCALLLSEARPRLCLAVATGRAEKHQRVPIGAAIDRAASILEHWTQGTPGVAVDDVTAGLLDPRFEVVREGALFRLRAEHADHEAARLLMGKVMPFVGRDKELGLLELTLRECIDESVARVVLVTGPPGQGKSRLRLELTQRVSTRGETLVLVARADAVGAGGAFLLVRQLVRKAVGLRESPDNANEQHMHLRAHVARVCPAADVSRIADFLGELIGAPSTQPGSELRAARDDPRIMNLWLRRSFVAWLAGECEQRPLLLIIEDMHWGDLPSVTYLGEALRALASRPFMLLALARPEIHELFPELWTGTELQEIALGRLTRSAAKRLIVEALPERLDTETLSHIVECADGNPFYLEELIRHVDAGNLGTLPDTVLAVVQSRLEQLDPQARRAARAASLFGEVFWLGGISAVLGPGDWSALLRTLCTRELISLAQESRYPGEIEYVFGHALIREAAYAMFTDSDRMRGHALVGDWLERAGEQDAVILAEHFELGAERARAVSWLIRAAQRELDGGNTGEAELFAQRGIACGATDVERGHLHAIRAQTASLRADWLAVAANSAEAVRTLAPGSPPWFLVTAHALLAGSFLADLGIIANAMQNLLGTTVQSDKSGPYGLALCCASQGLAYAGQLTDAEALITQAELSSGSDADLVFALWLRSARGHLQILRGDLGNALANLAEANRLARHSGAAFASALVGFFSILALGQTGHSDRTAQAASQMRELCKQFNLPVIIDWIELIQTWTRLESGLEPRSAITAMQALIRQRCNRQDQQMLSTAHSILSQALLGTGALAEAEQQAIMACETALLPINQAHPLGTRANIELRRARPDAALDYAQRGLEVAARVATPATESLLQLAHARALHGLQRTDEAWTAIGTARERVLRVAATLDGELREAFISTQSNAQILQLARVWLDVP